MYQDDFAVLRIRVSIVDDRVRPLPRQVPLTLKQLKQFCASGEVRPKLTGASILRASRPTPSGMTPNAVLRPAPWTGEWPRT